MNTEQKPATPCECLEHQIFRAVKAAQPGMSDWSVLGAVHGAFILLRMKYPDFDKCLLDLWLLSFTFAPGCGWFNPVSYLEGLYTICKHADFMEECRKNSRALELLSRLNVYEASIQ